MEATKTIVLGKFQVVTERLMEIHEVKEELEKIEKDLGELPEKVKKFILKQFSDAHNLIKHGDDECWSGEELEERFGGEGRIAWGMSHEGVMEDLCEAWGLDCDDLSEEEDSKVNSVYNTFFTE